MLVMMSVIGAEPSVVQSRGRKELSGRERTAVNWVSELVELKVVW